ncbi:MAG: succinate dehydrogenase, hydrophobic membrane anchor protein [Burkholderiales bacterium]|nr:succinate dehydrogenase, hydrophobic membrane anchor protein [Burkholderiales bacterium]
MVNRQVIGAHYGLRDWLAQRVTAVVMGVYTLLLVAVLASLPGFDYWYWRSLWELPVVRFATVLFLVCVYYHAWVGVRNIFMDYVKDAGLRLTLYVIVIAALLCYAFWSIQILWGLDAVAGPKL